MSKPSSHKIKMIYRWYKIAGIQQKSPEKRVSNSHQHLMVTELEWQAILDDFQQALADIVVALSKEKGAR